MIIYCCICRARDAAILVEVSSPDLKGNAGQVTATLMEHLRDHPTLFEEGDRKTFVQRNATSDFDFFTHFLDSCAMALGDDEPVAEEHYFHLLFSNGVYYCCIGDDPDLKDQKVNFAFLDFIQKEFTKKYRAGRINTAHAYSLDKNYSPNLRSAMHYHNINHQKLAREERVQSLVSKVEDLKSIMGMNLNLLMDRGEDLGKLVNKSKEMAEDATVFKKRSRIMKQRQRRKLYLYYLVGFVILASIFTMMLVGFCGVGLKYCRVREHMNNNNGGGNNNDENDNKNNNKNDNGKRLLRNSPPYV